jgi:SpoVK/Ycf46/Vps4 family AAA+-type ATPase
MSGLGGSLSSISEQKVSEMMNFADALLADAGWKPKAEVSVPGNLYRERLVARGASTEKVSFEETLRAIRKTDKLLNTTEHSMLYGVRRATQIALAVSNEYKILVGLDRIGNLATLSNDKKTELQEKSRTAAAIALFTWASYLQHVLGQSGNEASHGEHVTLPELSLDDPISSLRSVHYYLSTNVRHPTVQTDLALTTTIFFYAETIMEEIEKRKESFKYIESFEEITFGIEGTDFTIGGLTRHDAGGVSVEFNRVEMSSIVGNADAKHFARRNVERTLAYNFREKKSVFVELGGFSPMWMAYGKPGTGKSLLIAAIATMLHDYSSHLGIPFRFHPLPENIVDSYQGNSAKNMVAWFKPLQSPDALIFAPIDDAENLFEDRSRENVSEGSRAVMGVTLRYTEGAGAIMRGNASLGLFTNLPEQIDPAIRSRIQGRMVIDGAVTQEDFLDQGHLWWRKYKEQDGFVNLADPTDYMYLTAQGELKTIADARQTHDTPTHPMMKDIYESVSKQFETTTHVFFAEWYRAVVRQFPAFSSRDVRNIQSAIDQRIMDFDMPQEWFEKPDAFTALPYGRQKAMVLELRTATMQGLKLGEIQQQEFSRYLDNYASIANAAFDREVEARIKLLKVFNEAEKRTKRID